MSTPKTVFGLFTVVRDAMAARGVPFPLEYGPAQVDARTGSTRVIFQRDYDSPDVAKPAHASHRNPRMWGVRATSLLVRIHAQSTLEGARRHNHEELADLVADQVRVAIHKSVSAFGTTYQIARMGFVSNLDAPEGWQGVTYEIRFTVDRAESDVAWTGEIATEVSPAIITTHAPTGPAPRTDLPSATTRAS